MIKEKFEISNCNPIDIVGPNDLYLKIIKKYINVEIVYRGNEILITGKNKDVVYVKKVLTELLNLSSNSIPISKEKVQYIVEQTIEDSKDTTIGFSEILQNVVQITYLGKKITPKTLGQKKYVDAIRKNEIVFSIGPAGTGKTYLAVAMAMQYLKEGKVQRVILTRPAVEAGEKLGFLPGDLQQKVDPYLKPIYDSIIDMISPERLIFYKERGIIEIAPLAYMRGRTLNNSFIILDEAQNTTNSQMKMFLTRIGANSKAVITGDVTQIDLEGGLDKSGLVIASKILAHIKGISIVLLKKQDVVRHSIVKKIIKAYEENKM
jgi:phosphate starvation-inducible PhoH-like protein